MTGFVFFDDMRGDIDGMGAAAMLGASGAKIYGLITTTNSRDSVLTMAVLDRHYRPGAGARIGWDQRGGVPPDRDPFSRQIASEYPTGRKDRITGATKAFKRALRDARRDGVGVDVVATGSLDTLARAMDGLKPRLRDVITGTTVMAGSTSGRPEYNVRLSPSGANAVARDWPAPIRWLPFEQGVNIRTGSVLADRPGPVRRGYQLYPAAGGIGRVWDTSSWDKVAVAHALRPDLFDRGAQVQPSFGSDGTSRWSRSTGTGQRLLVVKSPAKVTRFINKLLLRA